VRFDQPGLGIVVGRPGGLADDRGRLEGADQAVDVPGAPGPCGRPIIETATSSATATPTATPTATTTATPTATTTVTATATSGGSGTSLI
jgi:hypothetical protein